MRKSSKRQAGESWPRAFGALLCEHAARGHSGPNGRDRDALGRDERLRMRIGDAVLVRQLGCDLLELARERHAGQYVVATSARHARAFVEHDAALTRRV